MAATEARIVHVPYVVTQDEDGAWCASAQLRPGVGAAGQGLTRQAAIADLKAGLGLLIEETGVPDELTITSAAPSEADPPVPPRRIDYYDDPDAPQVSSLVPSVNVVVTNDADDILMIRRTDNGNWAVPGGAIDLGESVAEAAVRETREETGIECEVTGIAGIYSDPRHIILYTSNGEARQEFSIVLTASPRSGQPTPSSESSEARWVPAAEVAGYTMDRSMRIRINDYLAGKGAPVIG
jgi:ADP-ribose pyrophosphatase YjhB (NUDIX family)/predicted RNase H-like HicB family nuclease